MSHSAGRVPNTLKVAYGHEAGTASGRDRDNQSGLRPANFTTLAHFAVSSASNSPYAAGDPISTDEPKSLNFAWSFGSASPALISLLSLSTISAGVSFGAPMPLTELAS